MFVLHPALEASSAPISALSLSDARMHLDARFPWIVLVPRVENAGALEDLADADRVQLLAEILAAGRAVRAVAEATGRQVERLNVGILGNITPQLHIHIVGRRTGDAAWPGPVWGSGKAVDYAEAALEAAIDAARLSLASG